MKKYVQAIIICGGVLVLFPFVALPEFWEYIYVIIPAAIISYCGLYIGKRIKLFSENESADTLQGYIQKLQDKFTETPIQKIISEQEEGKEDKVHYLHEE